MFSGFLRKAAQTFGQGFGAKRSLSLGGSIAAATLPKWPVVLSLLGLPSAAGYYYYDSNEGLKRTARFWQVMGPIYMKYRFVEWQVKGKPEPERDAAFDELHRKYAPVTLALILELKGFYIKIGQIGSTRADFVPPEYLERLETLQDQVPPQPVEYVKQVISDSLGRPFEEVFKEFDPVPLGAASIGQVHKGVLHDGRVVVVKVKYPNVENTFAIDMATIEDFCKLAQPEQVPFLREVRKQFMTEFDYQRESNMLKKIGESLNSQFGKEVRVPRPIESFCTRDVIVMEYLPGDKLLTCLKRHFETVAKMRGKSIADLRKDHTQAVLEGREVEKPPSARRMQMYQWVTQVKDGVFNIYPLAYNYTLGWFTQPMPYWKTDMPLNTVKILETLLKVFAHQIFFEGRFNGDPHPGNILLMPDGRLGLIDFGQVKELELKDRLTLAKLIVALSEGDKEKIFKYHKEMGFKSKANSEYVSVQLAIIGFDRCDQRTTEGMNLQQYLEHLSSVDSFETDGDNFVLASRVSILLRGLATHVGYPVRVAPIWRETALALLNQHGIAEKDI